MEQKIQALLIEDLDGSEVEGTVRFRLDGTEYEIDLNAGHAQALWDALSPCAWFANALVRDAEVSKRFREEFEQLWDEAPGRDHTLHVLQQSIDKISAVT